MKFAAIDIGTVTCRLLIADIHQGVLTEILRRCAITNLGVGVDKTSCLQHDAIACVVNQVKEYLTIIDSESEACGAACSKEASAKASTKTARTTARMPIVAFATSAARDAKNSQELVAALKTLGVDLSVISGTKEASLSFRGASSCFANEALLVVDIGGGSTEAIFGFAGQEPLYSHSFNIGCRRITERFLFSDPPSADELALARAYITNEMKPYFVKCLQAFPARLDRVVAVAGTATSVVSIDKKMKLYDSAAVHKTVVSLDTLVGISRMLAAKPLEQRQQVIGLEPQRAPVIVAGMLILEAILNLVDKDAFTVSELDILHGILLEESNTYLL